MLQDGKTEGRRNGIYKRGNLTPDTTVAGPTIGRNIEREKLLTPPLQDGKWGEDRRARSKKRQGSN